MVVFLLFSSRTDVVKGEVTADGETMNRPYKVPGSWPLASLTAGHATITVIVRWLSAVALRKIVLKISGEEQPLSDFYSAVFLEHWSFYETVIFAAVAGFLGRGATVMLAHFSVGAVCASSMEALGTTYGARVAASLRSEVSRYIMTHVTHSDRTNKEQVIRVVNIATAFSCCHSLTMS